VSSFLDKYELLQIHLEQFKRNDFSFIYKTDKGINYKQKQALELLTDKKTNIIDYGGGAGGAKSWTGGSWQIFTRLCYADTKGGIARAELKELRQTTLETIRKIVRYYGAKDSDIFSFNGQDNFLEFENGSKIFLISLKHEPSRDPEYDSLGSYELTDGWIEEAAGCNFKGVDVFKTRLGRWNNNKYNLPRKIFRTFNPQKNWIYNDIYNPFKKGLLSPNHVFIPALVVDNPNIDNDYIETLREIKDEARKQRLLFGNFDYDDDPSKLINYDCINNCFSNTFVVSGNKYISADIARFGGDKTVIIIWDGFRAKIFSFSKLSVTESAEKIKQFANDYRIPLSNIVVDEDGVGGGVKDILKCKGFVNNSRPIEIKGQTENYGNLKSQCYFKLADRINNNQIYIDCNDAEIKDFIIQELDWVKRKDPDKDSKLYVLPKEEIKENIGRSPDYADALMMREYFELAPKINLWTYNEKV
jgi:phage terminase large subunit